MIGCRYFRDAPQAANADTRIWPPTNLEAISQRSRGAVEIRCLRLQVSGCPDVGSVLRCETDPTREDDSFYRTWVHRRKRHFHAVSRFAATLSHANKRNFPPNSLLRPPSPSQPAMRCDGPRSTDFDDVKGRSDDHR
jgi:hypothetical protein